MKNLKLKQLIYGMYRTMVISSIGPKDVISEIEAISGSLQIDGFTFRKGFAETAELTDYTDEDYRAIMAQYALTYGWTERAVLMLGEEPISILEKYFRETALEMPTQLKSDNKGFKVEDESFYQKVLKDLAESKIVLRLHQIEILELMPIEELEKSIDKLKFTIKETEILFIKRLVEAGSTKFTFSEPDQIVRFVAAVCRSNGEAITGQLNKTILKDAKMKMPTSVRKKLLHDINEMNPGKAATSMHKYKDFWKRLFKQLAWTNQDKMEKRYPKAMVTRIRLFDNDYQRANKDIEYYRQEGDLERAFEHEMKNPGQMLRSLLFYLRYPAGSTLARKKKMNRSDFDLSSLVSKNKDAFTTVKTDISNILKTDIFIGLLTKANPKLLWQALSMLDDKKWYQDKYERKMNNTKIKYSNMLPGLDENMAELARKAIKKTIKRIKRKENESLGKVYIDDSLKNYKMQFTGREDTSITLTGDYLAPGSKLDLREIMKSKRDPILRVGLAWRGDRSCDIDLSLNIPNVGRVYYGNQTLKNNNGDVLISSSGDITSCGKELFSTELVDIDIDLCKKHDVKKFFNSAIIYSGSVFKNYDCYWFISVIEREDRVIPGRQITMKLDQMDYAAKIQDDSNTQLGFSFDLLKNEVEVINIKSQNRSYSNARTCEAKFMEAIAERPKLKTVSKMLKSVIKKNQIVDMIEEADITISAEEPTAFDLTDKDPEWIHPGRDITRLQEIIF